MYQIDNSTAASTQPASTAPGTPGFFTDGSVDGLVAPTVVPAEWLNAVQQELVNVVTAGGLSLSKSTFTQLRDAIKAILQSGGSNYALDTGAANAYAVTYSPAITAATDGLKLRFKAAHANTGASTFSPNGITAAPIVGGAHSALLGGEIVANGDVEVVWNSTLASWVLLENTGGPVQVAPGAQSNHAMQLGQATGVVGAMRNAMMNVATASASATFTADQVVVSTALNGLQYLLTSYSQSINLATTGAGGMDTGSAPVSGYVALYAIYNPTTSTASILATNATSAAAPTIYGGGHMPSGYTASALISVWPTNASSQFIVAYQHDRRLDFTNNLVLSTTTLSNAGWTSFSIASAVPKNAITVQGNMSANASAASQTTGFFVSGSSTGVGLKQTSFYSSSTTSGLTVAFDDVPIITSQTMYYETNVSTGATLIVNISGYTF